MRDVQTWAARWALLWTGRPITRKGMFMAHEEEPLLANPPTQEAAIHVHDYERFTRMMKYGAIACFIVGLIVLWVLY